MASLGTEFVTRLRRPRTRTVFSRVAVALAALALLAGGASAQAAATLGTLDPALHDLARLEALGLVPRGWSTQRPFSVGRMAWMVRDARALLAAADLVPGARADAHALLERLETRFGPGAAEGSSAVVEVEAGGGRGPGRTIPGNGLGEVDAVVLPLQDGWGGRSHGDRGTLAGSVRGDLALGPHLAVGVALRGAGLWWDGPERGRTGPFHVEGAYLRGVAGKVALQVGRDGASWGARHLLLSDEAPSLDLVRVSTDRPLSLHVLGETDFTVFAADLGEDRVFPHTRLFGIRLESAPRPALRMGLSLLDRRGGEGAPVRATDLDSSDRIAGVDARLVLPGTAGVSLLAGMALTHVERDRVAESMGWGGGYRLAVEAPRLGPGQRHALAVEAATLGPYLYRHHVFATGSATQGHLLGSPLGPDGEGVSVGYAYHAPGAAWVLRLDAALERRRADGYADRAGPPPRLEKVEDLPDETRARMQAAWRVPLFAGWGGVEVRGGVERVSNDGFRAAASSVPWAVSLRMWRGF